MSQTEFSSITALDRLLDDLVAGGARRRQLDMVRSELQRALEREALPVPAQRSLRRLLEEETFGTYVRFSTA
ncbi:hypothetical protein [Streptomyces sp. GbtcB6]|uniref:hypothetical protein n=1 Tax=Streptomyces sp. GbtcB6 TaxID=2824751 RepID=UPI0020C604D6|nr:hypothetical protein [Streptomyces sp. GbtcB6]